MSNNLRCQTCDQLNITLIPTVQWRCSLGHINTRSTTKIEMCNNCDAAYIDRTNKWSINRRCEYCDLFLHPIVDRKKYI